MPTRKQCSKCKVSAICLAVGREGFVALVGWCSECGMWLVGPDPEERHTIINNAVQRAMGRNRRRIDPACGLPEAKEKSSMWFFGDMCYECYVKKEREAKGEMSYV